jgi:Membrane bound FAD containing D-sorbitol dehydrogenase
MTGHDAGSGQVECDEERRAVLSGLALVCLAAVVGPAAAQTGAAHEAFLDLSRLLTGRASLDAEQAVRLFEAFASGTPDFETGVQRLLAWIKEHNVDAVRLQQALDAEASALAGLPRQVMTAWYTGVVGEGAAARCVTFETSLMHQLVADRLNPPSYCYGPHGSWGSAPV